MCIAVHYRMMSIGFRLDINIKAGDWLIPSTNAGRKFIGEGPNNKNRKKKDRGHFRRRIVVFLWSIHTNNTCVIVVRPSEFPDNKKLLSDTRKAPCASSRPFRRRCVRSLVQPSLDGVNKTHPKPTVFPSFLLSFVVRLSILRVNFLRVNKVL